MGLGRISKILKLSEEAPLTSVLNVLFIVLSNCINKQKPNLDPNNITFGKTNAQLNF